MLSFNDKNKWRAIFNPQKSVWKRLKQLMLYTDKCKEERRSETMQAVLVHSWSMTITADIAELAWIACIDTMVCTDVTEHAATLLTFNLQQITDTNYFAFVYSTGIYYYKSYARFPKVTFHNFKSIL